MADTMDVDVDPPTAAEPKGKTKEDVKGDKKRFEVKKVGGTQAQAVHHKTCTLTSLSGTRSLSGPGTLLSTTAPFAVTTSWISASNARPTRLQQRAKSALSPGVSAM